MHDCVTLYERVLFRVFFIKPFTYAFQKNRNFHEKLICFADEYSFYLEFDLYGTHSEQRGQRLTGLHFLYNRINPEQCYNELNRARLRKRTRKPFPVTLTFSSARALITNHRRGKRDIHSILHAM